MPAHHICMTDGNRVANSLVGLFPKELSECPLFCEAWLHTADDMLITIS